MSFLKFDMPKFDLSSKKVAAEWRLTALAKTEIYQKLLHMPKTQNNEKQMKDQGMRNV